METIGLEELPKQQPELKLVVHRIAELLDTDMSWEAIAEEAGVCRAEVQVVANHPFLRYLQGKGAPLCTGPREEPEYTLVDDSDW